MRVVRQSARVATLVPQPPVPDRPSATHYWEVGCGHDRRPRAADRTKVAKRVVTEKVAILATLVGTRTGN